MSILKKLKIVLLFVFTCQLVIGQLSPEDKMSSYSGNYLTFNSVSPKITAELLEMTPSEYHSNPEFGVLPYNAPCENCYELIHRRTDTTKYFVENGTYGGKFYSQTLLGLFHYTEQGVTKTYDGHLQPIDDHFFIGKKQDTPTFVDLEAKATGFIVNGETFSFNNNLTLTMIMMDETEVSLGTANWALYTIGQDGIRIINAWPNIDITIDFALDRIKTNYIINNPIGDLTNVRYLKFSDDLILPSATTIVESNSGYVDEDNHRYGDFIIKNEDDIQQFKINAAFGYDASDDKNHSRNFFYELIDNRLSMFVPANNWIGDPSMVYPITIDPQVTSTATQTAGWMSFQYNGAWCSAAGSCNYNLVVARPANSTITGTTFTAQYQSLGGYCAFSCWRSEAAFKIVSPCGTSPSPAATFWNCNVSSAGTCSATNVNVFADLGSCLGASCSGNVTFQIQNSYCYCSTGGNCGDNCQWMPNNTWSITLMGNTLETLGNTATGNGGQTIPMTSCSSGNNVTLNPTPAFGVPGFTYVWSNGATTPTVNIPAWIVFLAGSYTCVVTDACGVARTATFIVACPLGVEYDYFSAERKNKRDVNLTWSTLQESDNNYFEVQRSSDGLIFETIAKIYSKGDGDNFYDYFDENVIEDINYYRLANYNFNGDKEYTTTIKIDIINDIPIEIIPNPSSGKFTIQLQVPYSQTYQLEVTDEIGKRIYFSTLELSKGTAGIPVNLIGVHKGIYYVKLISNNNFYHQSIIIE